MGKISLEILERLSKYFFIKDYLKEVSENSQDNEKFRNHLKKFKQDLLADGLTEKDFENIYENPFYLLEQLINQEDAYKMSRRQFLKILGIGTAIVILYSYLKKALVVNDKLKQYLESEEKNKIEPLVNNKDYPGLKEKIMVGSIAGYVGRSGEKGGEVIRKISLLLQEHPQTDLVLTPEFSFIKPGQILVLKKNKKNYIVDNNRTTLLYQKWINAARVLAKKFSTNIVLGGFNYLKDNSQPLFLFINSSGHIVNYKIKYKSTEEYFTITTKHGDKLDVFLLICGETSSIFLSEDLTLLPDHSELYIEHIKLAKTILGKLPKNKKADILVHSLGQSDIFFPNLVRYVQNPNSLNSIDPKIRENIVWCADAFRNYYYYFIKHNYVNPNGFVVISDGDTDQLAAAISFNFTPFKFYKETKDYVVSSNY